jgi:hypothetical protein
MTTKITRPGKFEGEPTWAPHFHRLMIEGDADDEWAMYDSEGEPTTTIYSMFSVISDDEEIADPTKGTEDELRVGDVVICWENDDGFFHTHRLPDSTLDEATKWCMMREGVAPWTAQEDEQKERANED